MNQEKKLLNKRNKINSNESGGGRKSKFACADKSNNTYLPPQKDEYASRTRKFSSVEWNRFIIKSINIEENYFDELLKIDIRS